MKKDLIEILSNKEWRFNYSISQKEISKKISEETFYIKTLDQINNNTNILLLLFSIGYINFSKNYFFIKNDFSDVIFFVPRIYYLTNSVTEKKYIYIIQENFIIELIELNQEININNCQFQTDIKYEKSKETLELKYIFSYFYDKEEKKSVRIFKNINNETFKEIDNEYKKLINNNFEEILFVSEKEKTFFIKEKDDKGKDFYNIKKLKNGYSEKFKTFYRIENYFIVSNKTNKTRLINFNNEDVVKGYFLSKNNDLKSQRVFLELINEKHDKIYILIRKKGYKRYKEFYRVRDTNKNAKFIFAINDERMTNEISFDIYTFNGMFIGNYKNQIKDRMKEKIKVSIKNIKFREVCFSSEKLKDEINVIEIMGYTLRKAKYYYKEKDTENIPNEKFFIIGVIFKNDVFYTDVIKDEIDKIEITENNINKIEFMENNIKILEEENYQLILTIKQEKKIYFLKKK